MSDIAILKEMIKAEAIISLEDDPYGDKKNPKKQVTLTEVTSAKSSDNVDYSVKIRGMSDNAIVIKADAFRSPDTVFNGSKGECKRADFVIIDEIEKIILCIEMKAKATTSTVTTIIQQLKGAQCFVAYCQAVSKVFWEQKKFLDSYEYRFISFRNIGVPKKPTRSPPETGIHDSPERMLKIDSPQHIQFNHLVGRKKPKT